MTPSDSTAFRPVPAFLSGSLRLALVLFLAVWVCLGVLRPALEEPDYFASDTRIQDFASHLQFTRAVWAGRVRDGDGSIYTTAGHLRVLRDWTGKPPEVANRALPFGYAPTMLLVLGPFCPLPDVWAYALWTALGLAAIGWMTRTDRPGVLLAALCFLSPLSRACLALGQTAVLTTAALVFLVTHRPPERAGKWKTAFVEALILWLLTAKPPLAMTAGVGLLASGRWRPVILAACLTVLSTLALTPWLGPSWVGDYLSLITHYDADTADPAFARSLVPSYMSNARAVLFGYFGVPDTVASRISSGLWVAALAGLLVAAWRRRVEPMKAWAYAVLALVLLSPHANFTEDLHLFVLAVLPLGGVRAMWLGAAMVTGVVWLTPGGAVAVPAGWRWPLPSFVGKVGLVGFLVFWRKSRSGWSGQTPTGAAKSPASIEREEVGRFDSLLPPTSSG
jgi:hypothetical protein